ncbi:MAG: cell wall hydrolase [Clostridium butyricum]|nr:cell wall hydrolase [Clostridium butyricum]
MKKTYGIFFVALILCLYVININTIVYAKDSISTFGTTLNSAINKHIGTISYHNDVRLNGISLTSGFNNTDIDVFSYATQQLYITQDDIELMSKLVAAESIGEPYTGKVAVASVVLNRVSNPKFPNSIQGVIFQKNAFSCVKDNQIMSTPNEDCYRAVYEAINGSDPTNKALFFYNPTIATCNWMKQTNKINETRIGHHTFFKVE